MGISRLLQWINVAGGKVPILVFHRVSPHHDPFWPPITPEIFEETVVLLKKHYTILPLEQLNRYTEADLRRACFITFDDAFEDTFQWAIPILLKYNIPASFFVPTTCVLENEVIWPLQLRNAFRYTTAKSIDGHGNKFDYRYDLSSDEEKIKAYDAVIRKLLSLEEPDFLEMKDQLLHQLGRFRDPKISVMTVDHLKSISPHFGIHSHTHNHYLLSRLTEGRIQEEFEKSSFYLKAWVGPQNLNLLAYPVGSFSSKVVRCAENFFDYAFATGDRPADAAFINSNHHSIPRFNIHHNSAVEIFAFVNGFHRFVNSLLPHRRKQQ